MNGRTLFRIFLAVIVIAAVAALGFWAYNLGVAQGAAQVAGVPGGFRMGPAMMPWMMPGFRGVMGFGPFGWGFGLLGFLFQLFLIIGVIWLVSRLFFWGRGGWRGGWGRGDWNQGHVPPMFEEWHRRAHGEAPQTGSGPQEPPAGQ